MKVTTQGTFDHDKGQKSAISGRRLHWRLSIGFFAFFSSIYVQFSKTSPPKSGESSEKSSGENRVKSCHVCGCHGFFGPEKRDSKVTLRGRPQSDSIMTEEWLLQAFWVIFESLWGRPSKSLLSHGFVTFIVFGFRALYPVGGLLPSGPCETDWCRGAKIAARQFLSLTCLAITLIGGFIFERG